MLALASSPKGVPSASTWICTVKLLENLRLLGLLSDDRRQPGRSLWPETHIDGQLHPNQSSVIGDEKSEGARVLELQEVTKTFERGGGRSRVLDNFSLRLATGEVVLLQGPSGSGKSSVVRIAGLLSFPDGGRVLLNGESPGRRGLSELRRNNFGIVFQNANLLPELTVDENLAVASRLSKSSERARLLKLWGLEGLLSQNATTLSGGEAQRVAFCRALMNDPPVLLLDEPSAGLDQENTDLVKNMIRKSRDSGKAVLLVSHDPAMSDVADRIVQIEGGRNV